MNKKLLALVALVAGLGGGLAWAVVYNLPGTQIPATAGIPLNAKDVTIKLICTEDARPARGWYAVEEKALFDTHHEQANKKVYYAGQYYMPKMIRPAGGEWGVNRAAAPAQCRMYFIMDTR